MKLFYSLILLLLSIQLIAKSPQAFHQLGLGFERDKLTLDYLKDNPYFKKDRTEFLNYMKNIENSFKIGYELDEVILKNGKTEELSKKYLKMLRLLTKEQKSIEHIYVKALTYAIKTDDTLLYEQLLINSLSPLKNRSIESRVVKYYKSIRAEHPINIGEELLSKEKLELYSRKIVEQQMDDYEEHMKVLSAKEAKQLKKYNSTNKRYRVVVSSEKTSKGYLFYAENKNAHAVTITLDMKKMVNFRPSIPLPLHVELAGNSNKQILELNLIDYQKKATFSSSFGWVKGRASSRHDYSTLYRVPFELNTKMRVSQGFNGKSSHTGFSKYAIDFACPVGTKIFASRGGKVVKTASSHNKGGFERSYGKYANYIVIEHSDGTLGNYYHLKQDGVNVNVGDYVEQGDFIGYSGNTGYSSGPHLHFSVSKVEPREQRRPMTVPFRLRTSKGIVSSPKRGDWYTAVKVK